MRVCDGITYMVIGEAPDLSSVDEEIRHRWNSLSIDTARREPHASDTPLGPKSFKFPKSYPEIVTHPPPMTKHVALHANRSRLPRLI